MTTFSLPDGSTNCVIVARYDPHGAGSGGLYLPRVVTHVEGVTRSIPVDEDGRPGGPTVVMDLQDALLAGDRTRALFPDRDRRVLFDPAVALDTFSPADYRKLALAALVMCVAQRDEMPKSDVAAVEAARVMDDLVMEHLGDVIPPRLIDLAPLGLRMCHACGCTDTCGCAGGCSWAGPNLCSSCADLVPAAAAALSNVQITDCLGSPVVNSSVLNLGGVQVHNGQVTTSSRTPSAQEHA